MSHLQGTLRGAIEHRGVHIGTRLIRVEQLEVATRLAIVGTRTSATVAFWVALEALALLLIRVVIGRTLGLALLSSLVVGALGAHLFMVSVVGAQLAKGMALSANCSAGQWL